MAKEVPFEVGQLAESMSFEKGFRGAWFRCEIKKIPKSVEVSYILDFYDFPDDKPVITKVYQRRSKKVDKQLMIRPCYPTIYKESEVPDASEITEVAVVVDDTWRVGDLVDWSDGGCYWSGRIVKLLDNGKAQVDLLPQPQGEGESYNTCLLKDLRPSLDWSVEDGWTVPNQDGTAGRPCARLIGPPIAQVVKTANGVQETNISAESRAKPSTPSPLSSKSIDEMKTKVSKEGHKKGSSDSLISKEGDMPKTVKTPDSGVILKTKSLTRSPAKQSIPSPLSSNSDALKSTRTKEGSRKRSIESTISMEKYKVETVKTPDSGTRSPAKQSIPPLFSNSIDEAKSTRTKEACRKRPIKSKISVEKDKVETVKTPILENKKLTGSPAKQSMPSSLSSNSIDEVKSTLTKETGEKRSIESTVSSENDKVESIKIHDCGKGVDCDMAQEEPIFDCTDCLRKNYGLSEDTTLRSLHSDTIEAAVMDLEEYVNKIKWLRRILLNGVAPQGQKPEPESQYAVDKNAGSSKPK